MFFFLVEFLLLFLGLLFGIFFIIWCDNNEIDWICVIDLFVWVVNDFCFIFNEIICLFVWLDFVCWGGWILIWIFLFLVFLEGLVGRVLGIVIFFKEVLYGSVLLKVLFRICISIKNKVLVVYIYCYLC